MAYGIYTQIMDRFADSIPELHVIARSCVKKVMPAYFRGRRNRVLVVIFVRRGGHEFIVNGQTLRVRGGQVLVVPSGCLLLMDPHFLTRIEGYDLYLHLRLDRPFLGCDAYEPLRAALRRLPLLHLEASPTVAQGMSRLFHLAQRATDDPLRIPRLHACLASTAMALVDLAGHARARVDLPPYVQWAQAHMAEHLHEQLRIDDLVQRTGYSRSALVNGFRRATGLAPMEYFLQMRLDRAAELLRTTDQSVAQIAAALSFSSGQYLATAFKRLRLQSPTDHRRRPKRAAGRPHPHGKPPAEPGGSRNSNRRPAQNGTARSKLT